jgi:hypothetical protein
MAGDAFLINITPEQKKALIRRAAQLTVETGKRMTMSDLLRDALDQLLAAPLEDASSTGDKSDSIKFTPLPPIAAAIKRARLSSGKPIGVVVNELLAEALSLQEVSV